MAWQPIDSSTADNVNSALAFRMADNAVQRWKLRGRQASICYDVRDPVDVGSVGKFRRYVFPELRILPGFDSLQLRLRYKVTDAAGVKIRWGCWSKEGYTFSSSTGTSITSTTAAISTITLDISKWVQNHNIDSETMPFFLDIESQESASSAVAIAITGVSNWYIQTGTGHGITDPLACYSVGLTSSKSTDLAPADLVGGVRQTVSLITGSSDRFYIWPHFGWMAGLREVTTTNYVSMFGDEWNGISLQEYARLQFWAVGVEQVVASAGAVLGNSQRKPIINLGTATKDALRPNYPARASTHRPLYSEGQRFHETHTVIHSLGPYMGTAGLDFDTPNTTHLLQGTWAGYPSVFWLTGVDDRKVDASSKILFGCRVAGDSEFTPVEGATLVRRSLTVDLSLIFTGGSDSDGGHTFTVSGVLYSAGNGAAIATGAAEPITVSVWNPARADAIDGPNGILLYSLTHPLMNSALTPGSTNAMRRCNTQGLLEGATHDGMRRRIHHVSFEVNDPDGTNADADVLQVAITIGTSAIFGDSEAGVGNMRCFVAGWCVTSTQGGPPNAVGA